jgi:hypothetical protein
MSSGEKAEKERVRCLQFGSIARIMCNGLVSPDGAKTLSASPEGREAAGLSIRPSIRTRKKGGGVSVVVPHWGERLDEGGVGGPPTLLSVPNGFALTCSEIYWSEKTLMAFIFLCRRLDEFLTLHLVGCEQCLNAGKM